MKDKFKFIQLHLYPTGCILDIIVQPDAKVNEVIKKAHDIDINFNLDASTKGATIYYDIKDDDGKDEGAGILLFLRAFDEEFERTLVHEAVHVTYQILDIIGQKHDVDNHEIFAYFVDFIYHKTKEAIQEAEWEDLYD